MFVIQIKEIPGCNNYFADTNGNIYSTKQGYLKKLSPYQGKNNDYLMIKLIVNGERKVFLVHRLIGITFIPNPNNYPEIDHQDNVVTNNCVNNLKWCTRKENLQRSYKTMSPVRYHKDAKLFVNNNCVGIFESINKAVRYANKHYKVNISSLKKYHSSGNIRIESDSSNIKNYQSHNPLNTRNRNVVRLYKNGYLINETSTMVKMVDYFKKVLQIQTTDSTLQRYCNAKKLFNGYQIKRAE